MTNWVSQIWTGLGLFLTVISPWLLRCIFYQVTGQLISPEPAFPYPADTPQRHFA